MLCTLQIEVDPTLSLSSALQVAATVRHTVKRELPEIAEALVHLHSQSTRALDVDEHHRLLRPQSDIQVSLEAASVSCLGTSSR